MGSGHLIRWFFFVVVIVLILMWVREISRQVDQIIENQRDLIELCSSQNRILKAHSEIIKKGVIEGMDYDVVFVD